MKMVQERGGGDDGDTRSEASSEYKKTKRPELPEFDGRNSSWIWWKLLFEEEVLNVDSSPELNFVTWIWIEFETPLFEKE